MATAGPAVVGALPGAVVESDLKQPPWLLGIALWVAEVVLLWAGLTGPRPKKRAKKRAAPAKRKPKARRKPTPKAPTTPTPANVVPIRAA